MTGATLFTVSGNVVVAEVPWASVAVMVTVCDCSGPSVVANDQVQVPSALAVTVPTEAVSVTASFPTSANVPPFAAVWPSLTTTAGLLTVSEGGRFWTLTATVVLAANEPSSVVARALIVELLG